MKLLVKCLNELLDSNGFQVFFLAYVGSSYMTNAVSLGGSKNPSIKMGSPFSSVPCDDPGPNEAKTPLPILENVI
jgi:hypothetical protein